MGDVVGKFDLKSATANSGNCKLTLKARSENIVKLSTKSLGYGLISKKELMPGVYLAESLTKAMNGMCITSIINTLEEDITLDLPQVLLEEVDDNEESMPLICTAVLVEDTVRLSRLREQLRPDHLNNGERISRVKLCEEYNGIFHLPGYKLAYTTAAEHAITTPSTDPSTAINTKPYRIPEIHKEIQRQIEQMLREDIIQPSTSPRNSPILVVPK